MTTKELLKKEIDTLPQETIDIVYQFVEFQKYKETLDYLAKKKVDMLVEKIEAGEYVSDDEYLAAIPGMLESIEAASKEPMENYSDVLKWE